MIRIITSQPNIHYLSGFTGSVAILVTQDDGKQLIVDGRYTRQARTEAHKGIRVIEAPLTSSLLETAIGILTRRKTAEIGYEDDKLDVASFNKLKSGLSAARFHSISGELREQRCVKKAGEIDLIKKAALIADLTYDCVIRIIKPGLTELEISAHIDYLIKTFKGNAPAFETLVSSGRLSANPHGKPTDKKVKSGDLVLMDFGARYKGYNSDITRMVSLGAPSKRILKIYNAVLSASHAAVSKVRDGVPAADVDRAARETLRKEKLDKYFSHATGHGVGLQVHEGPRVSSASRDVLREGMVITIEPGVYLPSIGGFRVEDMVLVKKGGCEVITRSNRKLEVL